MFHLCVSNYSALAERGEPHLDGLWILVIWYLPGKTLPMDIECKSRSRWGKEARFDKLQEPVTMMMMLRLMRAMMMKNIVMVWHSHDTTGHQCLNCKLNNSRKKYNYTEHIFACWYFVCAPVGSCSSGGSLEVLRTRLRPEAAEHWGAQQTEKYISYRNWYRSILSYYRWWHSDCNMF